MLVKLENITKSYQNRLIFEDVNLSLFEGEIVSVIGPNGCGKTTLINILSGDIEPDGGNVEYSKGLTSALLRQVDVPQSSLDILTYIKGQAGCSEEAIDKLSVDEYLDRQIFDIETSIKKVLGGLGFKADEFASPVASLSKGQFRRVLFAVVLIKKSKLLILDEPTNHLDINSIEWLEGYIKKSGKAVIFVSHDKNFIENLAQRIVYFHDRRVHCFNGNYAGFSQHWENLKLTSERQNQNLQRTKERLEAFISRNIAGQKTKQAQSRRKKLSKLQDVSIIRDNTAYSFRFNNIEHNPPVISHLDNISFGYADKMLFSGVSLSIHKNDKIGITGDNGTGKTTLLNLITGKLKCLSGSVFFNKNIDYFFLSQESYSRYSDQSLFDIIHSYDASMTRQQVMELLGSCGFSKFADNRFKELSGGEKRRFQLAVSQIGRYNLLILDEPTNHLDIFSIENLIDALLKYNGCVIFVTHNRYFLEKVADKIIEIDQREITLYHGNYQYYKIKKESMAKPLSADVPSKSSKERSAGKDEFSKNQRQLMAKRQKEIEEMIRECESERLDLINNEFSNPDNYKDRDNYISIKKRLDSLDRQIEELIDELEDILTALSM